MNCYHCNIDKNKIILKNDYWTLSFHKQDYLGRCVLSTNRHVETFTEITNDELISFKKMLKAIENLLKDLYGCSMLNWCCNMNNVFSKKNPNPHVHIHIRPRYKEVVEINNTTYKDKEFGSHYDRFAKVQFDEQTIDLIYNQIKENITKYL